MKYNDFSQKEYSVCARNRENQKSVGVKYEVGGYLVLVIPEIPSRSHMTHTVVLSSCPVCDSSEMSPNREGFVVCKSCGMIQEQANFGKLSFSQSSNQSTAYGHAVQSDLNRTQLGTSMERMNTKYNTLENRQTQAFYSYDTKVHMEAVHETKRICSSIGLPKTFAKDAINVFKGVWEKTRKGSGQRNIFTFVPVVIYRSAQLLGYSLPMKQLLPAIQARPKRFRNVLISTYHLFGRINHYKNIVKNIKEICTQLKVPAQVFMTAVKIFSKERRELMMSTHNVAASAAVGLAIIALKQRDTYPMMLVSKHGNSSQAAMTSRMFKVAVKRKLSVNDFKIYELDRQLPRHYKRLIESTEHFTAPVMRDSVRYIHRIANELNMPYKVKKRAIKLLRANRRIFLMTTREVCASSAVGLAIITLRLREKHALYHIGKVMGCSSSSISARIFKVLKSRGIEETYKISRLDRILPSRYKELLGRQ